MKVEIWVLATDNGDGSAGAAFFASEELALEYMEASDNDMDTQSNPENLSCTTLEFNDQGVLLNSDKWETW